MELEERKERLLIIADLLNTYLTPNDSEAFDGDLLLELTNEKLNSFFGEIVGFIDEKLLPEIDKQINLHNKIKNKNNEAFIEETILYLKNEATNLMDCRFAIFSFFEKLTGLNKILN